MGRGEQSFNREQEMQHVNANVGKPSKGGQTTLKVENNWPIKLKNNNTETKDNRKITIQEHKQVNDKNKTRGFPRVKKNYP